MAKQTAPVEKVKEVKQTAPVEGADSLPLTTSISVLLTDAVDVIAKNTVTFIAEYKKDFEGVKPMMDGSIHEVDPSVAELFISKGFGKIV